MILRTLLSQKECEAYVMAGKELTENHPAYDAMCLYSIDSDYLVVKNIERHHVVPKSQANNYVIICATKEERERLINSNYRMIGLKNE